MDKIKDINSLIDNESFIDYALEKSDESLQYWEEYIKKYPEDVIELEKTKQLVIFLNSGKKKLPFNKARYELKHLNNSIDFHEMQNTSFSDENYSKKQPSIQLWLKIAAVFVLFFAIAGVMLKTNIFPYYLAKIESLEDMPKNQILVPMGEKSHVILSDGTEIWLNSGSKLTYPNNFQKGDRIVSLEGEAYFNVAKNKKQPFIVKTEQIDIEVLGTSFNLKSYPEEDLVETTLIEGSVKLVRNHQGTEKTFYLKPNEKASFNSKDNKMRIYKLPENTVNEEITIANKEEEKILEKKKSIKPDVIESIVSWKDQILVFNSENLTDIATKLERWYGCEIIINDSSNMLNETYTGKFVHNEPITMVLDVIKATTPIEYEIKHNTVIIKKNKSD